MILPSIIRIRVPQSKILPLFASAFNTEGLEQFLRLSESVYPNLRFVLLLQYLCDLFHSMKNCLLPFGSIPIENIPGAGSSEFFQEISRCTCPVCLLIPSFAPGSHVSVG
uniref:Uncharacterized protein n=1 Tax=Salix viminalis TaxID=40686 RepID=A0A6N2KT73_SALVM